uniref:Light harvesting complex protein 10 n=1 Tax=Guillardia theta TaxID=55529 RepID=A8KCR8_GUITH|nr:light harvesting complex protein 10 precursor [Guillardia theta]
MLRTSVIAASVVTATAFLAGPALPSAHAPARSNAISSMSMQARSKPLPWLEAPPALDGKMEGDVGFDPLWVSSMLPDAGWIKFLREAELKHGRVAMLAATGAIVQDIFTFPGVDKVIGAAKMTSAHDKYLSLEIGGSKVATMHQMLLWIGLLEILSAPAIVQTFKGETSRAPGDFGFDPLGFSKDAKSASTYRLKEVKNGRLAMIGIGGMVHHYLLTGRDPSVPWWHPQLQVLRCHDVGPIANYLMKPVGTILPKMC